MNKFHNLHSVTLLPWSGASLIAQLIKNPPAMQETLVWFLGREDLGRSPGERIGYPLQYFGASLVAQLVKNPPAMQKTWVQSLGWEDPLEKGKVTHTHSIFWPGEFHGLYTAWVTKSQTRLSDCHFTLLPTKSTANSSAQFYLPLGIKIHFNSPCLQEFQTEKNGLD